MIVLPTVRDGVFPDLGNLLGKGSYGQVFGPFTRDEIHGFLSGFYEDPKIRLNDKDRFVIKKVLPHTGLTCQDLVNKNKAYADVLNLLIASERRLFILPLVVGCIGDTMFEVQRFGGKEVYEVLLSGDKITSPTRFFQRLIKIMEACMRLADKGVLLTDLKPENMVMLPDGSVSVIDFDTKILSQNKPFFYTLHPEIIPIQFLNLDNPSTRSAKVDRYVSLLPTGDTKDSLLRFLHKSKDIPPRIIAKFSIVWCIAHIIYLAFARSVRSHAGEFMTNVLGPLIRERMSVPISHHTTRLKRFVRSTTKKKSDGRV